MNITKIQKERQIVKFERILRITFPHSYRQFLLEQGSAVIAGYRILGLSARKLKKESPSKSPIAKGLPVDAELELPELELPSIEELEEIAEDRMKKGKISVLEATEILRKRRKDLSEKLVVICTKKALTDGKEKALCMDLTNNPQDDAPLVEVSDINQEGAPVYPHHSFKEWLEHLRKLEERDKLFQAAHQRVRNRKNEIRERVIRKENKQPYEKVVFLLTERTK